MIADFEIIQKLWEYGHFFSPEALKEEVMREEDLGKLSLDDKVVKAAVRSMQGFMAPTLDNITMKLGLPLGSHVGEVDEPTRMLFEVPRCGHPDFLPPTDKMKLDGTGSWPSPCQKNGVTVNVKKNGAPAGLLPIIDKVFQACIDAYAQVGLKLVMVDDPTKANIQTYFRSFIGSTIGLSDFNNGSCGNQVQCRLSSSYVGYNRSLVLHEWGHNCNLQHTRGGIMNPVIMPDPEPFGWHKDDPSYPTLVRFFGGEPVDNPLPPTPQPAPPPNPSPSPTPFGFLKLPLKLTDGDGVEYLLTLWPKV